MKKRLLSLVMCVLMLLSTFVMASCGDDDVNLATQGGDDDDLTTTSSNSPMTICLYSIRGEGMTDEAIELVEAELNRISVKKYNTRVDLILIDEDKYAAMMFTKVRMSIAAYNTALMDDFSSLTPEEIDKIQSANIDYRDGNNKEYGIKEETNLSSEVLNGTLDIFLCYTPTNAYGEADNSLIYKGAPYKDSTGRVLSMFEILYNEKALAPLKSQLDGTYSDVKSELYTHALSYVEKPTYDNAAANDYYGIPNNYVYGSYEYTIFNENYVSQFTNPGGNSSDKSDYHPSPLKPLNNTRFNILCNQLKNAGIASNVLIPTDYEHIQEFDSFESFENFVNGGGYDFDRDGFISDAEKDYNDFAVAKITGSKALGELFENDRYSAYDVYSNQNKVTSPSDYCESMFCIGLNAMGADKKAERVKRSMDIIRLINTNKEFRNTLQYGVEGVHYSQYSEEEDVNPLKGAKANEKYYGLNPKYFGNMFLLYSSSDMTAEDSLISKDNWQLAKDQIVELVEYVPPEPSA